MIIYLFIFVVSISDYGIFIDRLSKLENIVSLSDRRIWHVPLNLCKCHIRFRSIPVAHEYLNPVTRKFDFFSHAETKSLLMIICMAADQGLFVLLHVYRTHYANMPMYYAKIF